MRRDLITMLTVLLITSGIAAAANVAVHKMDWIRRPLDPPAPPRTTQSAQVEAPQIVQEGSQAANGAEAIQAPAILEHLAHGTAFFVDAREPAEYASAHLRGAINVPASAIYANIEKVASVAPLDQLIIVYCGGASCDASHNVADALRRDFGYANVAIHEKGWEEIEAFEPLRQCITWEEAS